MEDLYWKCYYLYKTPNDNLIFKRKKWIMYMMQVGETLSLIIKFLEFIIQAEKAN